MLTNRSLLKSDDTFGALQNLTEEKLTRNNIAILRQMGFRRNFEIIDGDVVQIWGVCSKDVVLCEERTNPQSFPDGKHWMILIARGSVVCQRIGAVVGSWAVTVETNVLQLVLNRLYYSLVLLVADNLSIVPSQVWRRSNRFPSMSTSSLTISWRIYLRSNQSRTSWSWSVWG